MGTKCEFSLSVVNHISSFLHVEKSLKGLPYISHYRYYREKKSCFEVDTVGLIYCMYNLRKWTFFNMRFFEGTIQNVKTSVMQFTFKLRSTLSGKILPIL